MYAHEYAHDHEYARRIQLLFLSNVSSILTHRPLFNISFPTFNQRYGLFQSYLVLRNGYHCTE